MKIGTLEFAVILLVAYLVLGPDRTVAYARKLGRGLKTLKIYIDSFTEDIRENVTEPLSEIAEPLAEITKPFEEVAKNVQEPLAEIDKTVKQSQLELNQIGSPRAKPRASTAEELEEAIPIQQEGENN